MRKKYILVPFITLAIGASFLGNANGPGFDYTGSPGSVGSCANCHSGTANLGATLSIEVVEKGQTTPVTTYEASKVYTVTVNMTGGTSTKRGFMATMLRADNNNKIGNLSNASAGVSLLNINNRNVASHNTPSTTGTWTFDWTAPSALTGTVKLWVAANATNSDNNFSDDQVRTASLSLTAATSAVNEPAVAKTGIYPNPATNLIQLPAGFKLASIFDIHGKKVLEAGSNSIDITALKPGTYTLHASNSKTTFSERFVKL